MSNFRAWAQLVRLPNVFTVIADVSAAYLLLGGGPVDPPRWLLIVSAGVALYWAGMILNDVFDVARDSNERAERPLPAGEISLGAARLAGFGLLAVGIGLAAAAGRLPSEAFAATWLPAGIAVALAVAIVLYDGPAKATPLGPVLMGVCRTLSFLLGASPLIAPAIVAGEIQWGIPKFILAFSVGFGVYVMGLTSTGRREASSDAGRHAVNVGFIVTLAGVLMIALAPLVSAAAGAWRVSPRMFPLLIGVIAYPVLVRSFAAARRPGPATIQLAVKSGVLAIIPLAAATAALGAGIWGLPIFALSVPAFWLGARLRVT